jgi:hypothetical protein
MPTEEAALAPVAARAEQAGWMQMLLEPSDTRGIIEHIGNWEVDHRRKYTMHTEDS